MPLRLKSLELHGYKTFASRTLFEFSEKVTAIVGPNGSGKSNFADSLRWVLGEQSYTLLRAKKTEDMIFAGSEGRARAGMAQATITFDNSDGWLPIDFSEVAITRRAYRDGQNEYLINKQKVRLKDVSELLAQSGLAERTYTIIGQGLVDATLALKAEERRRLFEEAAGTGLHRTRREEALKRLETTRRNLDRVQDILAELQPRLRSLERQARRAQEYEQVAADLRVLLREWYGYHWHKSQQELEEAKNASRTQESALTRARSEHDLLEEKLSGLREQISALRASLNSWHRQSAQLHSRREALSRELAVADERVRAQIEQQNRAQTELARSSEELALQTEKAREADEEVARLDAELCEARAQVETARRALAQRQAERARVEKEIAGARQSTGALNNRQSQLQARLAERQHQADRAQQELETAQKAAAAAEKEVKAAQAWVQDMLDEQNELDALRRRAETAFNTHRQKTQEAEEQRRKTQEERAALSAELARQKAQIEVLEQAEKSLTGYASGTRLLLQAARKSLIHSTYGALVSQIQVPAEIETAVAAALGEFADSVVLDPDNDPGATDPALDLLEKDTARGVLLPLKSVKPRPALDTASLPDGGGEILGLAADLVRAPAELRPAVDLLLGQALIVRDRAAARRVLAHLPEEGRAVTLRGEVFQARGPVFTSGASEEPGGQTLLGRQRQLRELRQAADGLEKQVAGLTGKIQGLDESLQGLRKEGDRLAQAQKQSRQEFEQAAGKVNKARVAEDQAQRQARWQQEQCERLQADIRRGDQEAARFARELETLEGEIRAARERLREQNNALAALGLEELQAELHHWNTQAAVSERALADGKARQRERKAALAAASQNRENLLRRIEELEKSLQDLEKQKVAQRQAEGQIGEEIEAVRALIDPAEAELEEIERRQSEQQTAETAARQALTVAEHHHAQAKINLARRQESLESLQRRIEDDFGLVQFEYSDQVSGPTPLPLEGMVEQLPRITQLAADIEENIKRQRGQLRRMGAINPEAQAEYQEVKERFGFLKDQVADLEKAEVDIRQVIAELDEIMQREFRKTYEAVNAEFKEIFTRLFGGGTARLVLVDPEDLTNTGIDIEARLPGKRSQGLALLSGGERSLTAVALVFALLKVSPTPFCVLDEVDAMLDEANVGRFRDLLGELSQNTQFVVVTHNRNTVQVADVIYGITMGRDSASQTISLKLDEVSKVVD